MLQEDGRLDNRGSTEWFRTSVLGTARAFNGKSLRRSRRGLAEFDTFLKPLIEFGRGWAQHAAALLTMPPFD